MKIDHVALYVNDLEAARDFFVRFFCAKSNAGYHNGNTGFRSYFLSFEDGARIEIMNKPLLDDDAKGLGRTGYIHIAFSVGSREKVDELTAQIKAGGYQVVSGPRLTGDGYYESCIVGIEGNQVEIIALQGHQSAFSSARMDNKVPALVSSSVISCSGTPCTIGSAAP